MYIKRASKEDIPAIRYLLSQSGKFTFLDSCINKRDLSFCARDESGVLAGFVWCGLMANNRIAHIDYLCVSPNYAKVGIAKDLMTHVFRELNARGAKYGHAFSIQDEHQIKFLKNLQKSEAFNCKIHQGFTLEWFKE